MSEVVELAFPVVELPLGAPAYGGNQEWFSNKFSRNAGCASTAAANLAAYYAANFAERRGLYDGEAGHFGQAEYVSCMEQLYDCMTPGLMGYPNADRFAAAFVDFAARRGVRLQSFVEKKPEFATIQRELVSGNALALLVLFHRQPVMHEDNWHWLTITGYSSTDDGLQLILSNYGQRQQVAVELLLEKHPQNMMRLVYFHQS